MTLDAEAFNQVPVGGRPSGFYPEVDGSLAGMFSQNQVALIVGQKLGTGTAVAGVPVLVSGDGSAADGLFGSGSMLAGMVAAFRKNNLTTTLWVNPLDDNAVGVAATLDITVTGAATAAGTLNVYFGLDRVQVAVANGDTAATVATALNAAINATVGLAVTSVVALAVVTVTFRHKGEVGNDVQIALNRRGALGGEITPAGIAMTIPGDGRLSAGASNPDQTPAIAAIGDDEYDFIVHPFTDATSLDAWDAEMDRQWGPLAQTYGTYWTALSGSVSALQTTGIARNGKYGSGCGVFDAPGPAYLRAARYGSVSAQALANHPARPLHTLILAGELVPDPADRFAWTDRNTLLYAGISTLKEVGGQLTIDRAITFYQKNASGVADTAFLDVTTPATVRRIIREIRFLVHTNFIARRCVLVADTTPIGEGVPHATPAMIKSLVMGHYDRLQRLGLVERKDLFEALFAVNVDATDPTRINMLYTPDLANPLITFATKVQFSLQWPENLVG